MKTLGFTGTHKGMTSLRKSAFRSLVRELQPDEFHHGDCIGADAEAHGIVRELVPNCTIVAHPPMRVDSRAFCAADVIRPASAYIKRNRNIVNATAQLTGVPFEVSEQLRGGTWSTLRFAYKQGVCTHVIYPDGAMLIFVPGWAGATPEVQS